MAGDLKVGELRSALRRLDSANRALETCIQSLGECQETLQKSIQCQNYLNHFHRFVPAEQSVGSGSLSFSLQPVKAGFVPNENARTVPGHSAV